MVVIKGLEGSKISIVMADVINIFLKSIKMVSVGIVNKFFEGIFSMFIGVFLEVSIMVVIVRVELISKIVKEFFIVILLREDFVSD